MGFGILWLPAMLLVVALRYFREPQFRIGAATAAGTGGLVFATSGLFGLLIGNIKIYGTPLDAGGLLGMFTARFLDTHLSLAGSLIILLLIMIIALMILFDFSIVSFAGRTAALTGAFLDGGRAFLESSWERFREKREPPQRSRTHRLHLLRSSRRQARRPSRKSCGRRNRPISSSSAG